MQKVNVDSPNCVPDAFLVLQKSQPISLKDITFGFEDHLQVSKPLTTTSNSVDCDYESSKSLTLF